MTTEVPTAGGHEHRLSRVLVVDDDPIGGARLLGEWLSEGGLELVVARPSAGERLPDTLAGYAALVVLGREPLADEPAGTRDAGEPPRYWFPAVEALLRAAVRHRTPTLGIGLGARLLATAHAGRLAPTGAGPDLGPRLIARRDVADRDPVFGPMPFAPDVVVWHADEITNLPDDAVTLAVSTSQEVRAFRIGPVAWGLRFHIECDLEMVADWAMDEAARLVTLGYDAIELLETVDRALPDVAQAWRPFAVRFAELVAGRAGTSPGGSSNT